jgi:hypothetical protein
VFVDEFELPKRHDNEAGGAPDYAVLWKDRLWMIELKTEVTSHRPTQLPGYLELADHHHPTGRIDLTYLTPPMNVIPPPTLERMRFTHTDWSQLLRLATETWGDGTTHERRAVALLTSVIDGIGTPWHARRPNHPGHTVTEPAALRIEHSIDEPTAGRDEPVGAALQLAHATGHDGRQRALDHPTGGLAELQRLRLTVRDTILASPADTPIRHVRPWIWNTTTSGGTALTTTGQTTGYELRFSRYGRSAI